MRIGVLGGTGPAGQGLATRLAASGVEVIIGSRSRSRAEEIAHGLLERWPDRALPISGGDNADAAAADIVVVGTAWDAAVTTCESTRPLLGGKVVISMAAPVLKVGQEFLSFLPPRGSIAQWIQYTVPSALVSAAFHHLPARELGNLARQLDADVLVRSDHPPATDATAALVAKIPGLRPVDAGTLSSAMAIEAMTAVLVQVNSRYRAHTSIRLSNLEP